LILTMETHQFQQEQVLRQSYVLKAPSPPKVTSYDWRSLQDERCMPMLTVWLPVSQCWLIVRLWLKRTNDVKRVRSPAKPALRWAPQRTLARGATQTCKPHLPTHTHTQTR